MFSTVPLVEFSNYPLNLFGLLFPFSLQDRWRLSPAGSNTINKPQRRNLQLARELRFVQIAAVYERLKNSLDIGFAVIALAAGHFLKSERRAGPEVLYGNAHCGDI